MIGFANNFDGVNSGMGFPIMPYSGAGVFSSIEPMEMTGLNVRMMEHDLEELLDNGTSERIIADQLFIANRVDSLLGGISGLIEDGYFFLGRKMSGNSRHSLVLMCSYGEGSPLGDFRLGRYWGNDFLRGDPVDLMGRDREAKRTLRGIRSREGVGSLVINGKFGLYHSGIQLPNVDLEHGDYEEGVERGSKTEAAIAFSREHPTYGDKPVWFYKLNGNRSIIQNGEECMLYANNRLN